MSILEQIRFGQVYAFGFSPRPKTPAASYQPEISEQTKSSRLQKLFALTNRISLQLNEALIGGVAQVLIDGESRRDPDHWQGRGEDNRVVNFPKCGREDVGDMVEVEILRAGPHSLTGVIVAGAVRLPMVSTG